MALLALAAAIVGALYAAIRQVSFHRHWHTSAYTP
jgi:hypothetical protein